MFSSDESKRISSLVQASASLMRSAIRPTIEGAIISNDEVPFIKALCKSLPPAVDGALRSIGLPAHTRSHVLHQKPRVVFTHPNSGKRVWCELGDILYVVKYALPNGTRESKSVIWQVKSCKKPGNKACTINERQLELLHRWPAFAFGKTVAGTPQIFHIHPTSLDFGSYMMMLRRPKSGDQISKFKTDYGVTASAWRVSAHAGLNLDLESFQFCLAATDGILNQIAFIAGETHSTPNIQNLIDAIYRFAGWAPDPPDEFDGYFVDYSNRLDEGAFGVVETVIEAGGGFDARGIPARAQA